MTAFTCQEPGCTDQLWHEHCRHCERKLPNGHNGPGETCPHCGSYRRLPLNLEVYEIPAAEFRRLRILAQMYGQPVPPSGKWGVGAIERFTHSWPAICGRRGSA